MGKQLSTETIDAGWYGLPRRPAERTTGGPAAGAQGASTSIARDPLDAARFLM